MKRSVLIRVFIAALMLLMPTAVWAESRVVSAGKPYPPTTSTQTNQNQVDMWTRQLLYRNERIKFRRILETRKENFAKARRAALARYEQNLAIINSPRMSWNGESW